MGEWLKKLPLAPEYHPSEAEFADPISYILKIEAEARQYGICKIVPPFPEAPKRTAMANLKRSLLCTPTPSSARDILVSQHRVNTRSQGPAEEFVSDVDSPAKFSTRRQQLGCSAKRSRGHPQLLAQKSVWQSGERYTLEQFEAKAKLFARERIGNSKHLSALAIETLFWAAAADKPINVEYGNDIPGSAFGEPTLNSAVTCSPSWNSKKRKRESLKHVSLEVEPYAPSVDISNPSINALDDCLEHCSTARTGGNQGAKSLKTVTDKRITNASLSKKDMDTSGKIELEVDGYQNRSLVAENILERELSPCWKLANSAWNMRVVARSQGSLLRHMPDEIPGVTSPMIYIGMLFSWFAWHVEDHELHSLNYLHTGAPKTWYAVPGEAAHALEEVIRVYGYGNHISARAALKLLGEKTTVMSPEVLIAAGVPCCRLVQNAGEFIVTFPRAYHLGFSHGFNCGEAVNLATPEWLSVAKDAAKRRMTMNCLPMLSHEQLLYLHAISLPVRIPASLQSKPGSARLKDKKRSVREDMVKNVFVNDVVQNNRLLGILLDMGASTFLLVSDDTVYSKASLILDSHEVCSTSSDESIWEREKKLLPNDSLCTIASEFNVVKSPTCSMVHTENSDKCVEKPFERSNQGMSDADGELALGWGTMPCAACGILCFASMAVIQPTFALSESSIDVCIDQPPSCSSDMQNCISHHESHLSPKTFSPKTHGHSICNRVSVSHSVQFCSSQTSGIGVAGKTNIAQTKNEAVSSEEMNLEKEEPRELSNQEMSTFHEANSDSQCFRVSQDKEMASSEAQILSCGFTGMKSESSMDTDPFRNNTYGENMHCKEQAKCLRSDSWSTINLPSKNSACCIENKDPETEMQHSNAKLNYPSLNMTNPSKGMACSDFDIQISNSETAEKNTLMLLQPNPELQKSNLISDENPHLSALELLAATYADSSDSEHETQAFSNEDDDSISIGFLPNFSHADSRVEMMGLTSDAARSNPGNEAWIIEQKSYIIAMKENIPISTSPILCENFESKGSSIQGTDAKSDLEFTPASNVSMYSEDKMRGSLVIGSSEAHDGLNDKAVVSTGAQLDISDLSMDFGQGEISLSEISEPIDSHLVLSGGDQIDPAGNHSNHSNLCPGNRVLIEGSQHATHQCLTKDKIDPCSSQLTHRICESPGISNKVSKLVPLSGASGSIIHETTVPENIFKFQAYKENSECSVQSGTLCLSPVVNDSEYKNIAVQNTLSMEIGKAIGESNLESHCPPVVDVLESGNPSVKSICEEKKELPEREEINASLLKPFVSASRKNILRPRLLCLEHAVEAQHQLKLLGGCHVVVICHAGLPEIEKQARHLANELGIEHSWKTFPFRKVNEDDKKVVQSAVNVDCEQGFKDWVVQIGMSIRHTLKGNDRNSTGFPSKVTGLGKLSTDSQISKQKKALGKLNKQKKVVVAGRWCGRVWMSNQVHPALGGCDNFELSHKIKFYLSSISFRGSLGMQMSKGRGCHKKYKLQKIKHTNAKETSSKEHSIEKRKGPKQVQRRKARVRHAFAADVDKNKPDSSDHNVGSCEESVIKKISTRRKRASRILDCTVTENKASLSCVNYKSPIGVARNADLELKTEALIIAQRQLQFNGTDDDHSQLATDFTLDSNSPQILITNLQAFSDFSIPHLASGSQAQKEINKIEAVGKTVDFSMSSSTSLLSGKSVGSPECVQTDSKVETCKQVSNHDFKDSSRFDLDGGGSECPESFSIIKGVQEASFSDCHADEPVICTSGRLQTASELNTLESELSAGDDMALVSGVNSKRDFIQNQTAPCCIKQSEEICVPPCVVSEGVENKFSPTISEENNTQEKSKCTEDSLNGISSACGEKTAVDVDFHHPSLSRQGKPAGRSRNLGKKSTSWENDIKASSIPYIECSGGTNSYVDDCLSVPMVRPEDIKFEAVEQHIYRTRMSVRGPATRVCQSDEEEVKHPKESKKRKVAVVYSKDVEVEDRSYSCDVDGCTMSFNTKHDLNLHKHNTCTFPGCEKRFCSHKYLLQHGRVHIDDRPLKCSWKGCQMTFKWAWSRTEHYRVHTGERPYKCPVAGCGRTFRFVSDFSRHKRNTGHAKK